MLFSPARCGEQRDAFVEVNEFLGFVIPDESRRLTPIERPG
jgi:hypothetical protein